MKILSPISRLSEANPLIEAGAQELYCGLVTKEWEKRFGFIASVNLRHDRVANFSSFEELSKAVEAASKQKVPVFCVFNAHFYSEKQLPLVLQQIDEAVEAGISKVIVSDIGLISLLREKGFSAEIALSTGNPAFNPASLQFFKELGIKRIVLPRQLKLSEVLALGKAAKKLGLELEAFVLNAICPYMDGCCSLQHFGKSPEFIKAEELACRMPFDVNVVSDCSEMQKRAAIARAGLWQNTLPGGCGLCGLPSLKEAGISSLKIAGRGNSSEKKIADVKALSEVLGLLSKLDREGFLEEMKRVFFRQNHELCSFPNCYYPDAGLV